jgi:hypothetical protein
MELIMEPTTMFALFIGMIAVVHFLDISVEKIRSMKKTKVTAVRKKWYCFFTEDVLTGKPPVARDTQQDVISERKRRRLQEQRRPVLRL